MKSAQAIGAFLLTLFVCPIAVLAQNPTPAGPPVAFPQVTAVPIPFQSTSGRFSSLNPTNRRNCSNKKVAGRVVSARLIMVREPFCGRGLSGNVLVNVELANPADIAQMVVGRDVAITANLKSAEEARTAEFYADYLIAENAKLVTAEPPTAPARAFTSYMVCQPPDLDAFARQLDRELCVQNTIVENLSVTRPALERAAHTTAAPTDDVSGDPVAIICRQDLERSDMHLSAIACARGNYWVWYQTKWRDRLFLTPAPP